MVPRELTPSALQSLWKRAAPEEIDCSGSFPANLLHLRIFQQGELFGRNPFDPDPLQIKFSCEAGMKEQPGPGILRKRLRGEGKLQCQKTGAHRQVEGNSEGIVRLLNPAQIEPQFPGQLIPEDKGGFVIFLFPQLRKGNVKLNSGFPDVESQETVAEIIHAGFCPADSRRPAGEVLHHRNGKDTGKRAGRLPGLHGGTAERRHIDKHLLRRSGSGEKSRKEQKRHQQTGQPFSEFRTRDPASPSPGEVFSGTGIQTHLLSFRNLRLTNRVLFQLYSILQGKEVRSAIFFCL